jgi:hypothetical protein
VDQEPLDPRVQTRECWGRTRLGERCRRQTGTGRYCPEHRRQPFVWLFVVFLVPIVIGLFAGFPYWYFPRVPVPPDSDGREITADAIESEFEERTVPAVQPHLYVQHNENYSYLYLSESVDKNTSNVEDSLTLKNISDDVLTFFRVTVYAYTSLVDPRDFYQTYSLNTQQNYTYLGMLDVGSLNREEEFIFRMTTAYEWLVSRTQITSSDLQNLLFPKLGESVDCVIDREAGNREQAYTDDEEMLGRFFVLNPKQGSYELDGICGVPLKVVVSYRVGTQAYSLLFMGGTYYYGRTLGDSSLVAYPTAVAGFIKPRLSLLRPISGAMERPINMDLEIAGRHSGPLDNPDHIVIYTVTEPRGEEQIDQQLALNIHRSINRDLADQANREIRGREYQSGFETLSRLINLEPHNSGAIEALEWVRQRL